MADLAEFRTAIRAAMRSGHDSVGRAKAVATVGAVALPGDGAAITLIVSEQARQTLAVTDPVIAAVERAQFTVGEGPSLDALTRRRPVLVPDLTDSFSWTSWPGLVVRLADLEVGALFAFPMRVGATAIGAALCYRRRTGELDRAEVGFSLRAVDLVTLALLQMRGSGRPAAMDGEGDGELLGEDWDGQDWVDDGLDGDWIDGDGLLGTRAVHQATGMVMVQLGGVASTTAFARMRAYAFAHDYTLEDVADAIVARRLVLQADPEVTT